MAAPNSPAPSTAAASPTRQAGPALRPFGALRFALAVLVMIHHFGLDLAPEWARAWTARVAPGDIAVTVFFALSGFIILEAIGHFYARRAWPFLINRALRILPQFAAALAATVLVYAVLWQAGVLRSVDGVALGPAVFSLKNIAANALSVIPLSGRFGPAIDYLYLWPVWSLRVELVFYLAVFAAVAFAAAYRQGARYQAALDLSLAALALAGMAAAVAVIAARAESSAQFAPYFVFGGTVFLWAREQGSRKGRVALVLAVASVPLMLWQMWGYNSFIHLDYGRSHLGQVALHLGLLGAFVWLAAASVRAPGRLDRRLGDLAYPLFLNHLTVGAAVRSLAPEHAPAGALIAMVLSVALAWAMERAVEPVLKSWRNRWRGAAI
ncbi:MAG: acyltransferase family protein [Rhodospirillales bacterium]